MTWFACTSDCGCFESDEEKPKCPDCGCGAILWEDNPRPAKKPRVRVPVNMVIRGDQDFILERLADFVVKLSKGDADVEYVTTEGTG